MTEVLSCEKCGSVMEIDLKQGFACCPTCGAKAPISSEVLQHLRSENEHEYRMLREKLSAKKRDDKRKDDKAEVKWIVIFFIGFIIFLFGGGKIISIIEGKENDKELARLTAIVEEVKDDISHGNYDDASLKAITIVYHGPWENSYESEWVSIQKELIKQINEAKKKSQ